MKIGVSLVCQNTSDWDRYLAGEMDAPPKVPDSRVYDEQLHLGGLVEPLGFDSMWTIEHHFTPYGLVPNPLQFLAYFAGRTSRIDMGTMVAVVPWHDPVRLAEEVSILDNLLQGRNFTLGVGRGAANVEFAGFRQEMGDSRDRFLEGLEIVRKALTQPVFSHDGAFHKIPEMSIRPQPRSQDLVDRMACAWGSPASLPIAANAGLSMLFIPQKGWAEYASEVTRFNEIRAEHGWEPEQPIVVTWAYCAESEQQAWEEGTEFMRTYWQTAIRHYQLDNVDHFRNTKGYEHYEERARHLSSQAPQERAEEFARNQVWGTPEMCIEKLREIQRVTTAREFVAVFSYGSMPVEKAEASMRLFAEKVLPAVQEMETA